MPRTAGPLNDMPTWVKRVCATMCPDRVSLKGHAGKWYRRSDIPVSGCMEDLGAHTPCFPVKVSERPQPSIRALQLDVWILLVDAVGHLHDAVPWGPVSFASPEAALCLRKSNVALAFPAFLQEEVSQQSGLRQGISDAGASQEVVSCNVTQGQQLQRR